MDVVMWLIHSKMEDIDPEDSDIEELDNITEEGDAENENLEKRCREKKNNCKHFHSFICKDSLNGGCNGAHKVSTSKIVQG